MVVLTDFEKVDWSDQRTAGKQDEMQDNKMDLESVVQRDFPKAAKKVEQLVPTAYLTVYLQVASMDFQVVEWKAEQMEELLAEDLGKKSVEKKVKMMAVYSEGKKDFEWESYLAYQMALVKVDQMVKRKD